MAEQRRGLPTAPGQSTCNAAAAEAPGQAQPQAETLPAQLPPPQQVFPDFYRSPPRPRPSPQGGSWSHCTHRQWSHQDTSSPPRPGLSAHRDSSSGFSSMLSTQGSTGSPENPRSPQQDTYNHLFWQSSHAVPAAAASDSGSGPLPLEATPTIPDRGPLISAAAPGRGPQVGAAADATAPDRGPKSLPASPAAQDRGPRSLPASPAAPGRDARRLTKIQTAPGRRPPNLPETPAAPGRGPPTSLATPAASGRGPPTLAVAPSFPAPGILPLPEIPAGLPIPGLGPLASAATASPDSPVWSIGQIVPVFRDWQGNLYVPFQQYPLFYHPSQYSWELPFPYLNYHY